MLKYYPVGQQAGEKELGCLGSVAEQEMRSFGGNIKHLTRVNHLVCGGFFSAFCLSESPTVFELGGGLNLSPASPGFLPEKSACPLFSSLKFWRGRGVCRLELLIKQT